MVLQVSEQDQDLLQKNWTLNYNLHNNHEGYFTRKEDGKTLYIHKVIAKRIWPGYEGKVDHRDGNPYNCQRGNLRQATTQQNAMNQRSLNQRRGKFKGVERRINTFCAYIKKDGRRINIGHYPTEIEAALAYNVAAAIHFGEFACFNHVPEG